MDRYGTPNPTEQRQAPKPKISRSRLQKFRVYVEGTGERDGMYREIVASSPGVAIHRALKGGLKDPKLAVGQHMAVTVTRWA